MRFGYIHFAFLGDESVWAAEASECAADQDAFWEYHDLLFDRHNGENQGTFAKERLKQFARDLSLDGVTFDTCLDTGKYTNLVKQETASAQALGVSSTPTFVLNGEPVMGAESFDYFKQLIEAGLR